LRAQWFALPLLRQAGKVVVVNVEEKNGDQLADVERFTKYLTQHGVKAAPYIIKDSNNAALALQQYYEQQGADLLVMGAYSHSRLTELVFGGFTRHFLESRHCNLLLAH
jgi:nucleotide-binding universal stress UspA family protein